MSRHSEAARRAEAQRIGWFDVERQLGWKAPALYAAALLLGLLGSHLAAIWSGA